MKFENILKGKIQRVKTIARCFCMQILINSPGRSSGEKKCDSSRLQKKKKPVACKPHGEISQN